MLNVYFTINTQLSTTVTSVFLKTMKLITVLLLLFVSILVAVVQADKFSCKGKKDGYYEISCKSFIRCKHGQKKIHYCKGDTVLDKRKMKCRNPKKVPKPCGKFVDCSHKKDGRYPDLDFKCKSYYTCKGGQFMGHNFCPKGLVFNKAADVCDWPNNVAPPCGNKKF